MTSMKTSSRALSDSVIQLLQASNPQEGGDGGREWGEGGM